MRSMGTQFRIITSGVRHEIDKIKGSRFIATVEPLPADVSSVPEAVEHVVRPLRRDYPAANHHCWAWRLGRSRDHFRWSDDGEPSGSAGRPILKQIESRQLTNILVVVTRIFGGTKLGVGGLVRAYGSAAAAALDLCPTEAWIIRQRIDLSYAYELDGVVKAELRQAGLEATSSQYGSDIQQVLHVAEDEVDGIVAALRERTAGRIQVRLASD
jgi:uncharacterized YigZ family protein